MTSEARLVLLGWNFRATDSTVRDRMAFTADEEAGGKDQEESGSSAYVAPEKDKDTQLQYALDLLRGNKSVNTDSKKKAEAN